MRLRVFLRLFALLALACLCLGMRLQAQDSATDSVAEAARRARAQKKASSKPTTVITDDTLKPASATPETSTPASSAGASSEPGGNATPPDAKADQGSSTPSATDEAEKAAQLNALKEQIASKQTEVDLAQRQLDLDSDTYYSKTNYQGDKDGARKIASEKDDLSQKKEELASLKAKLASLSAGEPAASPAAKP